MERTSAAMTFSPNHCRGPCTENVPLQRAVHRERAFTVLSSSQDMEVRQTNVGAATRKSCEENSRVKISQQVRANQPKL